MVDDDGADEPATKREGIGSLHKDVPGLDRGHTVGRYMVLDVIGQGGMGIIYAAYDPELDRKVAVKLLQADAAGSGSATTGSQAWLVREAQAMARLAHPNVVAVHDVGVFDDRVFIAMELVDGVTLREWLKQARRPWQEVVAVMRAAGAGLAAAHAVGLVHRDFKPENVLVGKDGRVRVMDFGLARMRAATEQPTPASRESDLSIESRSPLTDDLTELGTVMGTPAYMAPEVHDGLGANARSDQFAFSVALFEALYRMRPYDKADLRPTRTRTPVPRTPLESDVPAKVHRVVMRAIQVDPEARFPSMAALLAELALDPFVRRRRIAIAAGVGLLVAAGGAGALILTHRGEAPALCTGTERALAGVWDAPIKLKVHAAFTATKKPYAEQANAAVTKALDSYLAGWTTATVGNCEATRIRGEQTEQIQAIRQLCLDQRFEEARSLAQLLQDPSATLVEKADKAVWELDPIAGCANAAAIVAPEVDPKDRGAYTKLMLQTAAAHAQAIGGELIAAEGALMHVADEGKKIHAHDVVALALHARAAVLLGSGRLDEGYLVGSEAVWTAMRARREDIVAASALTLASARAEGADHLDVADIWVQLATASAARSGGSVPALDELRLEVIGVIAAQRGDFKTAVANHEKALEAAKALWGATNPAIWGAEVQLAATLGRSGAWIQALPHLEHARQLREASVGPDHPDVALILSNLAACYEHAGESDKALATVKKAFQIREKTYGPNSPFLVATLNNLADFELRHHELAPALADIDRARAIAIRIPGPMNPIYHVIATTHAEVLGAAGRVAESRKAFDEVLALEDKAKSPELGTTLASRAALELAQAQWKDAAKFEERAIAAYEAAGGPEHLSLWKPLAGLAQARRALVPQADVKPLLDRALAIGIKAQLTADDLNPIRDQLAKQ